MEFFNLTELVSKFSVFSFYKIVFVTLMHAVTFRFSFYFFQHSNTIILQKRNRNLFVRCLSQ